MKRVKQLNHTPLVKTAPSLGDQNKKKKDHRNNAIKPFTAHSYLDI